MQDVFSAKIGSLASLKGGHEGSVALGGGRGVENWCVGGAVMRNGLAKFAPPPTQHTFFPIILHPCLALVSHCLRLLRPMLW
jgi:hypothetical protein